ncbi:uncharacterized protein METZ01_LOCUS141185 [marine metagenome]|uniref:RimM N-terminal domain-containing protein n=1 Tax=marine metagenome TaxID=408172 RepID=A0A381ZH68_9ZZZZ
MRSFKQGKCLDYPLESVLVARIGQPHGLDGSFLANTFSDYPHRFDVGSLLFLDGKQYKILKSLKVNSRTRILKLEGISTKRHATEVKNQALSIPLSKSPKPASNSYYHYQLIGLEVRSTTSEFLGCINEIIETGSNDVYVVKTGETELLIPAIKSVINQICLKTNTMTINNPNVLR